MVAAIYIRGGLFELGQDYLNYFISERGFQRKEAELLMIRLRSKKLMSFYQNGHNVQNVITVEHGYTAERKK